MKINEKNMVSFATCQSPVDKEGYLSKKGDVKGYQRRWFVLKGNLLFYFDKKQDKEPSGLIVLESCSVQASAGEKHAFEISFDGPGTRTYFLVADNDEEMQSWMRAVSHASYEYLKSIVTELQRQVDVITSRSQTEHGQKGEARGVGRGREGGGEGGRIPTVSKPKMRVENGIVVDVEEAPPIPIKQKRVRKVVTQQGSTSLDAEPKGSPVRRGATLPHASPMVPFTSSIDPRKPHSPPSTLDRTPTLTPTTTMPPPEQKEEPLIDFTDMDYDTPPPPVPQKSEHLRRDLSQAQPQPFVDQPSTHSSAITKKPSASSDHSKTVYEMHRGFTEAMEALKNERSSHQTTSGHLPS